MTISQYVPVNRTEFHQIERSSRSFDLFDAKGRELGYTVAIDFSRYEPRPAGSGQLALPEHVSVDLYTVEPHALKDGKHWGAIPVFSRKVFFSLDEAHTYAEELFANALKRAGKQAVAR